MRPRRRSHPDGSQAPHQAVAKLKAEGVLPAQTLVRTNRYLNNMGERLRLLALEWPGARVDDTGNRCELLINGVKTAKSKMLIDLNQKVSGMAEKFLSLLSISFDTLQVRSDQDLSSLRCIFCRNFTMKKDTRGKNLAADLSNN
jgi:hypothetical protein